MLIFDIETGPLADEQLFEHFTFDAPPHPGEFNPASVKYGNTKDEAKRAAKLEECRQAHAAAVENYERDAAAARDAAWLEFKSKAALSAITGQVLAIGIRRGDKAGIFEGPEAEILAKFWKKYTACRAERAMMVGANIMEFDLPFLVQRSWILKVDVPATVCEFGKWGNFDKLFVDIRQWWQMGKRDCPSSLDTMARSLGVGQKTEGIDGGDFARLWFGTPEEKQQARGYLLNDLLLTDAVAARLGVI